MDDIADEIVENLMSQSNDWHRTIVNYRNEMKRGFYDKDYIDMIVQVHRGYTYTDAYFFAVMHKLILYGTVTWCQILVGDCPSADKEHEDNNRKLAGIASPFSAYFEGGAGDCDGFLKWTKPVKLGSITFDGREVGCVLDTEWRDSCPLEVGYTRAHTTYNHVVMGKTLARWPYDSDWIYLLHAREHIRTGLDDLNDKIQ